MLKLLTAAVGLCLIGLDLSKASLYNALNDLVSSFLKMQSSKSKSRGAEDNGCFKLDLIWGIRKCKKKKKMFALLVDCFQLISYQTHSSQTQKTKNKTKKINQKSVTTASCACFSGRFFPFALAFTSWVTVFTWQLTLCRCACAERCIRRDNEQRTPSWEWGN